SNPASSTGLSAPESVTRPGIATVRSPASISPRACKRGISGFSDAHAVMCGFGGRSTGSSDPDPLIPSPLADYMAQYAKIKQKLHQKAANAVPVCSCRETLQTLFPRHVISG